MTAPARPYTWPPFEPGNAAAVTHGAYSPGRVEPRALALREALLAVAPWCSAPAFHPAVVAWSYAEAQCQLIRGYVDEQGIIDEQTGEPIPAVKALDQAEKRAERARRELGLTPLSWAQLRNSMTAAPPGDAGGIEGLAAIGAQYLDGTAIETEPNAGKGGSDGA